MTYLLLAGLLGGGAGVWIGWAHGAVATLVAAPVGASVFAFSAALGRHLYLVSFAERPGLAPRGKKSLPNIDAGEKAPWAPRNRASK
jgi:hypothetical protein